MRDGLEATHWAVTECADADRGDLRRTQRLVPRAQAFAPRRGLQPARAATLALRYGPLPCRPPQHRKAASGPAVGLSAGQGGAGAPPAEVEPLEWLLLTTVAVETVDDAMERVPWDAGRGGMAVWRRMLQSGGRLAARQCQTAERGRRALALSSVLAWWIFYATRLARTIPAAPGSVLLEPDEWPALSGAIPRVPPPPVEPPTRGQAVTWIAPRGGCVGRRRRERPGAAVLWRGLQHLGDLTTMYGMMRRDSP